MLGCSNVYTTPAALAAVRSGGDAPVYLHVPHAQLALPPEAQQGSVGRRVHALHHPHLGAGATYVIEGERGKRGVR